jgi:hypothetical protein
MSSRHPRCRHPYSRCRPPHSKCRRDSLSQTSREGRTATCRCHTGTMGVRRLNDRQAQSTCPDPNEGKIVRSLRRVTDATGRKRPSSNCRCLDTRLRIRGAFRGRWDAATQVRRFLRWDQA